MSRLLDLVAILRNLKIKIWAEGDNLRISAPPGTLTPELRHELSQHKKELLVFLRETTQPILELQKPLQAEKRPARLPLSFAQERLWFLNQMEPESPMYNIPMLFTLRGKLDVFLLEQSLALVIERHESLRTVFAFDGDTPCQVVTPPTEFHLEQVTPANGWRAWVQAEANRPFDLARGPLLRAFLIAAQPDEAILFINIHHIATDGWSTSIFLREISQAYTALQAGQQPNLPALPVQYADFSLWQRGWLQAEILDTQLDYWRRKLRHAPTTLELPTDHPRPAIQTYRGALLEFPLPAPLVKNMRAFSREEGVTPFMTLLAVFQVLLSRYSRQVEFTIGTPIANRTRAEIEGLIGFFVNTLVLRANLTGNPGFRDLLQRVRETSLEAYAHQDVPFEKLVDELKIERDLSRNALFQVMFIAQNTPSALFQLPGVIVEELSQFTDTSKFDLSFSVSENAENAALSIQYSTDLFAEATIRRMAAHYLRLLENALANPEQKTALLPMLTERELHQIVVEWNDTRADFPKNQCVQDLFEAQVEKTPEAVAVQFENQSLTYRELNQKANQVAHALQSLGIGPDSLVGICLERSLEMVIGIYGILKAGAAYAPLDPTYPPERVAFMLADSKLGVLLTQTHLAGRLRQDLQTRQDTQVLCLDDGGQFAAQPTSNPHRQTTPNNLAYLIYTSGSTGKPKGALNTHAGIFNRMVDMHNAYPIGPGDTVLQKTPFSFDVSVWEFLLPLLFGARLVVARPDGHKDPQYLIETIQKEKVSIIHFVPSMLYAFLETPGAAGCVSLKWVLSGGEALSSDLAEKFFAILPAALHNMYGPAEAAVDVTCWPCQPGEKSQAIPIGRPLANTQLYILDEYLQPLPIGCPGELHVGGVQVGRGYLHRPELSAERFLQNPFHDGILYKTGDLARYRVDGAIEFLGRLDHQVKIRGFRIELGEIETALREYPGVQKALVVAQPGLGREKQLVAYLVPEASARTRDILPELRQALKHKLPEYMLPSGFILLEEFPLNPSGKIDRNALPRLEHRALTAGDFAPPQGEVEAIIAQLWAELLQLPQVGRFDNFFELGGDSILSLQFINRARNKNLYITPRQVFEAQTIEALAQLVRPAQSHAEESLPHSGDVPLTPIQRRFFEQHTAAPHHYNQAVLLESERQLIPALLSDALAHLLVYHEALRLRFAPTPNGWRQWLASTQSLDGIIHWENLAGDSPALQAQRLQEINAALQASLNLEEGPLLRLAVFDDAPGLPQKLLFIIHHLAVDFVSWQILIPDLWALYDELSKGRQPQLPAPSHSFHAWARWIHNYAQSKQAQSELGYWLEAASASVIPLPMDFPENAPGHDSNTVTIRLSQAETQTLLRDVPPVYHTQINDLLLAALAWAFAEWRGHPSLLADLEGHGREAESLDLSRTVGWFTSVYPARLDAATDQPGALIKAIKEQLRRIPQKGFGYGALRYLNPEAALALGSLPQAQVSFNYGGQLKAVSVQSLGDESSPGEESAYAIAINGSIINNQLSLSWSFSPAQYRPATIINLANRYLDKLRELVAHCLSPQAGGYTPSDFPLSGLSQAALDRLVGRQQGISDIYPLSPLQTVMLTHSLAAPDSGVFFTQGVYELSGQVDTERFKAAWQYVVDRHTTLRTSFAWEGLENPLQIVYAQTRLNWDEQDWQHLSVAAQQTRLQALLDAERKTGFLLTRPPLPRCALIQTGANRWWFIWQNHHLLTDGWSSSILFDEMLAAYSVKVIENRGSRPYRDYIAWLTRQDLAPAVSFWQEHMAGFSGPTPLPSQKTNQLTTRPSYAEETLVMHPELNATLQTLCQRQRVTLNTVCQAAWALTLMQNSGRDDVVFGVTVSGRSAPLADIEKRVGLFINTLPLRVRLEPNQPWESWMQNLMREQTLLEQYAYTPNHVLAQATSLSSAHAIFLSNLRFQNYPSQTHRGSFEITHQTSVDWWHYPLNLVIVPGSGLQWSITYERSWFEPSDIRQVLQKLEFLLFNITRLQPEQPLHSLLAKPA